MEGGVIVFHRIKDIMSLKKYVLLATFQDGTVKTYDVSSLLEEVEAFNALKDTPHLFEQVKVDVGGYGISWNDEIDLSCDEIWDNGVLLCENNGLRGVALKMIDIYTEKRDSIFGYSDWK